MSQSAFLNNMDFLSLALELFRNADHFIFYIAENYGWWVYFVLSRFSSARQGWSLRLFFRETLCYSSPAPQLRRARLEVSMLILLITLGAILGNTLNYYIGSWLGNKIYDGSISWIDQSALQRTHDFYEKHGGKTIVLARFVPIVRSFAPLVAGAAKMEMGKFQLYNCTGAFLWVTSIVGAGYLFGNIPFIKNNLSLILIVGILAALVPFTFAVIVQFVRKKILQK